LSRLPTRGYIILPQLIASSKRTVVLYVTRTARCNFLKRSWNYLWVCNKQIAPSFVLCYIAMKFKLIKLCATRIL